MNKKIKKKYLIITLATLLLAFLAFWFLYITPLKKELSNKAIEFAKFINSGFIVWEDEKRTSDEFKEDIRQELLKYSIESSAFFQREIEYIFEMIDIQYEDSLKYSSLEYKNLEVGKIKFSEDFATVEVKRTVKIRSNSGSGEYKCIYTILFSKVNGKWYIDSYKFQPF